MPLILSILGVASFALAALSFFRLDGLYVEPLAVCGTLFVCSAEIISAIYAAQRRSLAAAPVSTLTAADNLGQAMVEDKLTEIHDRLIKIQVAIQNADARASLRAAPDSFRT